MNHADTEGGIPIPDVTWNIQREGRAWTGEELRTKPYLGPDKMELIEGKLFWDDEQRLFVVAMMLENLGVDKVIRLGDPKVWREALDALEQERRAGTEPPA
jgi:hypothetical protein